MAMQIRAELCHVDTLRCVVRVEAWDGERQLGSALGEDQSSEAAEDRAVRRLMARLGSAVSTDLDPVERHDLVDGHREVTAQQAQNQQAQRDSRSPSTPGSAAAEPDSSSISEAQSQQEQSLPVAAERETQSEAPTDPEDWSDELTAIDLELRRIGWDRSLERVYLERAFGHGSRHRLTRYGDLVAFLRQLRQLQPDDKPETASVPIRRNALIEHGDQMLIQLQWSRDQARDFLQQHQQASSRQQLSDEQLLQFNIMLEDQLNSNDNPT